MINLIRKYLKKDIGYILAAFGLIVVQTVIQMVFLLGETKRILDIGVANGNMRYIFFSASKMILYTLLVGICAVGSAYMTSRVSGVFLCHMRRDCYKKVLSFTPEDFDYFGSATLLTRTTDDPNAVVNLVQLFIGRVAMVPIVMVCILVMVYINSKSSFFILVIAVIASGAIMAILERKARPLFGILQKKQDRLNLILREKIAGVRSIRAFGNESYEQKKGIQIDTEIYEAAIKANRPMKYMNPVTLIIINWAVVIIYFMGTNEIRQGLTSISSIVLIFQYLSYFLMALSLIPTVITMTPKAIVSGARILELLEYEPKTEISLSEIEAMIPEDGSVEFRNVTFKYEDGRTALENVSFKIEDGGMLAIIGSIGAGKSTLLNLMMGFYKAQSGEILLGGVPIEKINHHVLLEQFSYSSQKSYIFQDTVRDNITAFHKNVSDETIMEACKNSCFDEVLDKLENGLDTEMAQGGMNISGGQRKRLALSRALAKNSKIYLLDDPFAALDTITEGRAKEAVLNKLRKKTVIMIASKISTISDADQILVLDNGKIAGIGKHEELLKKCKIYRELYDTQCYLERNNSHGKK